MLVVTLGDPYSVNCHLLARCLADAGGPSQFVMVGSYWHWQDQVSDRFAFDQIVPVSNWSWEKVPTGRVFLDLTAGQPDLHRRGDTLTEKELGMIAVAALNQVPATANRPMAVVTAPIDKHHCQEAGFGFPGQTEFFEDLWGPRGLMFLAGPKLKVGLVTNHLSLRDVPDALSKELIQQKIRILNRALTELFQIRSPRIGVCGLNPHCGDRGLFGREDQEIVEPAVRELQLELPGEVFGPLPADTLFYRAYHGYFDAVLALYHDQGLGPLKTVHFDDAVNITAGLPYLRISPDHGPARDLFGKGGASTKSMAMCFQIAQNYLRLKEGA